jgi:hypothetical protein
MFSVAQKLSTIEEWRKEHFFFRRGDLQELRSQTQARTVVGSSLSEHVWDDDGDDDNNNNYY